MDVRFDVVAITAAIDDGYVCFSCTLLGFLPLVHVVQWAM